MWNKEKKTETHLKIIFLCGLRKQNNFVWKENINRLNEYVLYVKNNKIHASGMESER